MSLFQEILLKLSEPVALSNYQSVLQLAVGFNLAISGYTELRTKVEGDIEKRTSAADRNIREVLRERESKVAQNATDRGCIRRLETARTSRERLIVFTDEYYAQRSKWKKSDRVIVIVLMAWSLLSLACLVLSSSSLSNLQIDNRLMMLASGMLILPAGSAVARALWLTRAAKRKYGQRASTVTGQITRLFNEDFLRFDNRRLAGAGPVGE